MLGGAGAYGAYVADALAKTASVETVVVGFRDLARAERLAEAVHGRKADIARVDIGDADGLRRAAQACDVVVNAAGPSYRVGPPALRAAIACGTPYVDLCDDARAAEALLELDGDARSAGVTALIGCGCSPGITNLAARAAAMTLDRVDRIEVMLAAGPGRPVAGPSNVLHLLDLVDGVIPVVRSGRRTAAAGFCEVEEYDFGPPLGAVMCGLIAHPEPVMFLRTFPELAHASAKLGVGSEPLIALLQAAPALGLTSDVPVEVGGDVVSPREVIAAHLYEHLGFENDQFFEGPGAPTAVHVVVQGKLGQSSRRIVRGLYQDIGPLVGAAMAIATTWVGTEHVHAPGVHTPEALLDPVAFSAELVERSGTEMELLATS